MRRSRTLLIGGLMVVGLLIGPGAGAAAARPALTPSSGATGWLCGPNGTGGGSPTTTVSSATIYQNNMSSSAITCYFPNIVQAGSLLSSPIQFGGSCLYENGNDFVSFQHRIYVVHGNTASLACWGGVVECTDALSKLPSVAQCPVVSPTSVNTRKSRRN